MLVCVYVRLIPISQGHKAVWQRERRVVEPITGHFKLMAAMKVRGELYANCKAH